MRLSARLVGWSSGIMNYGKVSAASQGCGQYMAAIPAKTRPFVSGANPVYNFSTDVLVAVLRFKAAGHRHLQATSVHDSATQPSSERRLLTAYMDFGGTYYTTGCVFCKYWNVVCAIIFAGSEPWNRVSLAGNCLNVLLRSVRQIRGPISAYCHSFADFHSSSNNILRARMLCRQTGGEGGKFPELSSVSLPGRK